MRTLLGRQIGREEAEKMLTTAERLRREGRQEGEVIGKRGMLLVQLRQRFRRIPAAALAHINEAGPAELNVWSRRVLTASSLDDVLEGKVAAPPSKAPQRTRA